jgi:predicted alpha/beta hydrolase family esterase
VIVIVHGYDGSGPGHWQRWLAAGLTADGHPVRFPDLPAPAAPDKDAWVTALGDALAVPAGTRVVAVCHSLGCWALDHWLAAHGAGALHAALLVAPPSPFLLFEPVESFLPPPRIRDAWAPIAARSLVVGSDDDDYASEDEIRAAGRDLGTAVEIVPGAGHLNPASGYGPWPFARAWVERALAG